MWPSIAGKRRKVIEIHKEREKEQKTMTTVMSEVWLLGNDSIGTYYMHVQHAQTHARA